MWRAKTDNVVFSSPAIGNGYVYFGSWDDCVTPLMQTPAWRDGAIAPMTGWSRHRHLWKDRVRGIEGRASLCVGCGSWVASMATPYRRPGRVVSGHSRGRGVLRIVRPQSLRGIRSDGGTALAIRDGGPRFFVAHGGRRSRLRGVDGRIPVRHPTAGIKIVNCYNPINR